MDIDIPQQYRDFVKKHFPELEEGVSFVYSSPVDYNYNCLAWALSCNTKPFENYKGAFWPWTHIPDDTAEGWAELFMVFGFEKISIESINFEPGFEKVVILRNKEDELHACRQDQGGMWKSKLGDMGPDIDHDSLDPLRVVYGDVVYVLKKKRNDWQ